MGKGIWLWLHTEQMQLFTDDFYDFFMTISIFENI